MIPNFNISLKFPTDLIINVSINPNRTDEPPRIDTETIIGAILIALGILTNGLALMVIAFHKKTWTVSNGILVSMFTSCLLYDTLAAIPLLNKEAVQINAPLYCSLLRGIRLALILITLLHHCLICLNRYLKVVYPFQYHRKVSYKYAIPAIVTVWLSGLFVAAIPYFSFRIPKPTNECIIMHVNAKEAETIYMNAATGILYFFPLVILIISYGHLFYVINVSSHSQKLIQEHRVAPTFLKHNRKLIIQSSAFLGIYIVLWTPFQIVFFINSISSDLSATQLRAVTILNLVALSYLVINPLLFLYHIKTLRQETSSSFRKMTLIRGDSRRSNGHLSTTQSNGEMKVSGENKLNGDTKLNGHAKLKENLNGYDHLELKDGIKCIFTAYESTV